MSSERDISIKKTESNSVDDVHELKVSSLNDSHLVSNGSIPLSPDERTNWNSIARQSSEVLDQVKKYKSGEIKNPDQILEDLKIAHIALLEHCSQVFKVDTDPTSPLPTISSANASPRHSSGRPPIKTSSPAATLAKQSQGTSPSSANPPPIPIKPSKSPINGTAQVLETTDDTVHQELVFDEESDTASVNDNSPSPSNVIAIIKNSYFKFSTKKNKDLLVFIVDLYDGDTNVFKYSIEKQYNAFVALNDTVLSEQPSLLMKLSKIPDKSMFITNIPSKSYIRRTYLEAWLQNVIAVCEDSPGLISFLTSDKYVPQRKVKRLDVVQEGYVFKKAKGPGNWKLRYYVLRDNGTIDYYESEKEVGTSHRGSIKLKYSVLVNDPDEVERHLDSGLVPPEEKSEFENAFILTEYKKSVFSNCTEPIPINGNDYLLLAENKVDNRHLICTEDSIDFALWIKNLSESINACRDSPKSSNNNIKSSKPDIRAAISSPITAPSNVIITSSADSKLAPVKIDDKIINSVKPMNHTSTIRGTNGFNVFDENQRILEIELPPALVSGSEIEYRGGDKKDDGKKLHKLFGKKKENKNDKLIFGIPLEQAVALYHIHGNFELPIVIYRCIEYIEFRKAEEDEGIYRLSGSASAIQALKEKFNTEGDVDICSEKYVDVNVVAGLLKLYLRELPDPILTIEYQKAFLKMIEVVDKEQKVHDLKALLSLLPVPNYVLLKALCAHLLRIVKNQEVNKMTLKNIGIIFSPTLGVPAGIFSLMLSEYWALFEWNGKEVDRPPRFAASSEEAYDIISEHTIYKQDPSPISGNAQTLLQNPNLGSLENISSERASIASDQIN